MLLGYPTTCQVGTYVDIIIVAVVGRPVAGKFDGKIWMNRISKVVSASRNSYNVHVSTNYELNYDIKTGEWMVLFSPFEYHAEITVEEALERLIENYDINTNINLCFSYKTFSATDKSHKWVRLTEGFLLKGKKNCSED